jgi:hypothetical protein
MPRGASSRNLLERILRDLGLHTISCPVPVVRDIIPGRGIPAGGVAPPSNTLRHTPFNAGVIPG